MSFFSITGWIAAAIVILFAFYPQSASEVKLIGSQNADWRGHAVAINEVVPNQILHLQTGVLNSTFLQKRKWYLKDLLFPDRK